MESYQIDPNKIIPVCPHCGRGMYYVADGTYGYLYECQTCDDDYQVFINPNPAADEPSLLSPLPKGLRGIAAPRQGEGS